MLVHQDSSVYVSSLTPGVSLEHEFDQRFGGYLYVISGALNVGVERLEAGDAAKIEDEDQVTLEAREPTEVLMVDIRVD